MAPVSLNVDVVSGSGQRIEVPKAPILAAIIVESCITRQNAQLHYKHAKALTTGRLCACQFTFKLRDQLGHRFSHGSTLCAPTVVQHGVPISDRILVHGATVPPSDARYR
jgi:hypothetical protein